MRTPNYLFLYFPYFLHFKVSGNIDYDHFLCCVQCMDFIMLSLEVFFFFLSFVFFVVVVVAISWAAPAAYGGSQARG